MNIILAASDFSPASRNAVNYAAELAKNFKCKLVLFNACSVPVIPEAAIPAPNMDEVEKESLRRLKRIAAGIHKIFGARLNIECVCRCGFAADEINQYAEKHKVSLIVMGMQGAGYLAERISGSVTTTIMSSAPCPLLSIDKQVKFAKPKKIVFASDLKEMSNTAFTGFLKNLVSHYKAELQVLNVFKPNQVMPSLSEAVEGLKLEHLFKGIKHSFQYAESADVVEGINRYVEEHKCSMVVMIARKHSFFSKLISEPNTKKMAFHSRVPLLTFHN